MSTDQVDIEKILRVATTVASGMGLNSDQFEKKLREELFKARIDREVVSAKPKHVYTLEFLRALTETPSEISTLTIPKVGSENPRTTANAPHPQHAQKGKYKPRGVEFDTHTFHPSTSRDIVRSTPPPVVQRGENAWLPAKEKSENDPLKQKLAKIKSDLNKISTDNEETISGRICDEFTEECIAELTPTFFDKGVWEQKYREIYARLCVKLSLKFPGLFLSALLSGCQNEFEKKIPTDAEDDIIIIATKRRLGAIYFIVEMLRVSLLKPGIVVSCANKILISSDEEKSDHDICHIAELIIVSLPVVNSRDVVLKMVEIIEKLKRLKDHQFVSNRSTFKIEDAVKALSNHK